MGRVAHGGFLFSNDQTGAQEGNGRTNKRVTTKR
jgi:hypothetical protein